MLVRNINKAKWRGSDSEFPADAITLCLGTRKNELSFWFSSDSESISDAVLAVVTSKEHASTIDVVVIDESEINKLDIGMVETPGKTASVFSDLHRDLVNLDFWKLGYLAEIIVSKLESNQVERITASKIIKIIQEGVDAKKVKFDELSPHIQGRLKNR